MSRCKVPDAHLGVVVDKGTGLYHGAVYLNKPTPSGCARYMLQASLKEGHESLAAAAGAANAAFPDVAPLDVAAYVAEDVDLQGVRIPIGATVTRITTQRSGDSMEGAPEAEVSLRGRVLDLTLTGGQVERMRMLGLIEMDCCSGRDPVLHYHYEHYELTALGTKRLGYRLAA